jgi:hypothetical protein
VILLGQQLGMGDLNRAKLKILRDFLVILRCGEQHFLDLRLMSKGRPLGCRAVGSGQEDPIHHSCCREQGADAPSGCYSVLGRQKDQSIAYINSVPFAQQPGTPEPPGTPPRPPPDSTAPRPYEEPPRPIPIPRPDEQPVIDDPPPRRNMWNASVLVPLPTKSTGSLRLGWDRLHRTPIS